jgi:hypothetical protein
MQDVVHPADFFSKALSERLLDRFMAGQPTLDLVAQAWRVPVLLAYSVIGSVGQTGEITVSATAEEIISHIFPRGHPVRIHLVPLPT